MDETDDEENIYEGGIFTFLKKEEFVDLIRKCISEQNNELIESMMKYRDTKKSKYLKETRELKKSIKHNKSLIERADEDDDYLIYYLNCEGIPCLFQVGRDYKKRVYDLDKESYRAYG